MFGLSVTVIFLVIGMSFGQQCNPLGERIVCGYFGIDQSECEDTRGCCWNDEKKDVPWCYRNTTKTCDPEQSRLECGDLGIEEPECIALGCCWKESWHERKPWCFYPVRDCDVDNKVDCGYPGIGERECLSNRCCFNEQNDEPQCFFSNRKCEPTAPRKKCGYPGIGEFLCMFIDCCWAPSDKNGVPLCYAPSSD